MKLVFDHMFLYKVLFIWFLISKALDYMLLRLWQSFIVIVLATLNMLF